MKRLFLATFFLFNLCACSSQGPIIDKGSRFDPVQYEKDVAACKQYQQQVQSQVGKSSLSGAIVGGLIGAITGDIGEAAAVGAVAGGADGAGQNSRDKKRVLHNCLIGRGYRVLN